MKSEIGARKEVQDNTEGHRDRRLEGLRGLDLNLMASENPMKALSRDAGSPKLCINVSHLVVRGDGIVERGKPDFKDSD